MLSHPQGRASRAQRARSGRSAGGKQNRKELFVSYFSDNSLERLSALLAWQVRREDADSAFDVLMANTPYAARLRFAPRPASLSDEPGHGWTTTVAEARGALLARKNFPSSNFG